MFGDIFEAIKSNDLEETLAFIRSGADLNLVDEEGNGALHLAAREGKLSVVESLVSNGVIIEALDSHKRSALFIARDKGFSNIVRYLGEQIFIKLKMLVQENRLLLYSVISLPRSRSTAFEIALTEAPEVDAQINEPHPIIGAVEEGFDNEEALIDLAYQGLDHILCRVGRLLDLKINTPNQEESASERSSLASLPLTLVIKDTTGSISDFYIEKLRALTGNFISTVRNPVLQTVSLVIRVMNEHLCTNKSTILDRAAVFELLNKGTSEERIYELIAEPRELFRCKVKQFCHTEETVNLTSEDLYRYLRYPIEKVLMRNMLCWERLGRYIKELSSNASNTLVVIDTETLLNDPDELLMSLANRFPNLTYHKNMVDNWTKASRGNFYNCTLDPCFAQYQDPAVNSTGFHREGDAAIASECSIRELPDFLQTHITNLTDMFVEWRRLGILLSKSTLTPVGFYHHAIKGEEPGRPIKLGFES